MRCGGTRKTRLAKQQLINKFIGEMQSLLADWHRSNLEGRE